MVRLQRVDAVPATARRRVPRRGVRRARLVWAPVLLAAAAACGRPAPRVLVAFVNANRQLARVVQEAVAEWPTPSVVPVAIPGAAVFPSRGDAAEVDYAEAAIATAGVVAVVGHPSSRASLLAAPIYGEAGIPFIVATGTSRRLRDVGPWTFQLAPDDEAEGAFLAGFALDTLAARRLTIVYLTADEYGIGLRDGVVRALAARGVEPSDQVGILEDTDFPRRVAASLRHATPQVVVVATRTPEASQIARALHARLPRVPVLLGDGVTDSSYLRGAGPLAQPAYHATWWRADDPDSSSRSFVARFERIAGRQPLPQEAMYYDGVMVAAQAVREVGPRRVAIQHWLRELGVSRPPYRGVTGPIAFTRNRAPNLVMSRLSDGAMVMGAHH